MRKLCPFKIGTNFQTRVVIAIVENKLKKRTSRKVVIFPIVIVKNTVESTIVIMNLLGEKCDFL